MTSFEDPPVTTPLIIVIHKKTLIFLFLKTFRVYFLFHSAVQFSIALLNNRKKIKLINSRISLLADCFWNVSPAINEGSLYDRAGAKVGASGTWPSQSTCLPPSI